jgi:hypothetical protein
MMHLGNWMRSLSLKCFETAFRATDRSVLSHPAVQAGRLVLALLALLPDEPAKLKPDDPISIAAAAIIKVFLHVSRLHCLGCKPQRQKVRPYRDILIEALKESVLPSAREPIEG